MVVGVLLVLEWLVVDTPVVTPVITLVTTPTTTPVIIPVTTPVTPVKLVTSPNVLFAINCSHQGHIATETS